MAHNTDVFVDLLEVYRWIDVDVCAYVPKGVLVSLGDTAALAVAACAPNRSPGASLDWARSWQHDRLDTEER
jgi:hypothetical protein